MSRAFAKIKQLITARKQFGILKFKIWNLFRVSDLGFRILRSKQVVGLLIALIVSGLIVSLLFPTGQPISAAGFLTSTTDADGNAHLGNNGVNDTNYYDTTTDSDPTTQELLGVDPNWKNGVARESYAVNFDGSNDNVNIPDSTSLEPTTEITFEAWVNPRDVTTDWLRILDKANSDNTGGYTLGLGDTNGTINVLVGNTLVQNQGSISANQWTHVAAQYNGSAVVLYINGVLISSTAKTGAIPYTNSGALYIGIQSNGTGVPWNGLIDEVRISNIARYKGNFTAPRRHTEDANTVGLWHFDEGTGTTANDSSPFQNTGTLTSGPTWVTGARAIQARGANNITLGSTSSKTNDTGDEITITRSPGLSFDGTNDYVQASRTLTTTTYSIAAWINPSRFGGSNQLNAFFYQGTGSNNPGTRFTVGDCTGCTVTNGNSGTLFFENEDGATYLTAANNAIFLNVWQHVVITKSGATETMYINGTPTSSRTNGNTTTPSNNNSYIGFWYNSTDANRFFQGTIDEPRIYNRALAASEITGLYNGRTNPDATGLVGLWHFDEGAGTSAYDYSGQGNTGTLAASPGTPTWVEGVTTYPPDTPGLKFDGVDDYVTIPDNNSLSVTTNGTWSAWVYVKSFADARTILRKDNGTSREYVLNTQITTGIPQFVVQGTGGQGQVIATATTAVTLNGWSHVLVTYDGSNVRFYLNSVLDKTVAATQSFGNGTTALTFGWSGFASPDQQFMNGLIDDARIYNRALGAGEIIDLYQQRGFDNNTSGLVGKWDFNDGQGTTATDTSGQGNNGTLTGANGLPKWDSGVGTGNPATGPGFAGNKNVTGQSWYTWRQKGGTFATIPIRTHDDSKQIGSENVFLSFANNANWSTYDFYLIPSWAVEATSTIAPQRGTENAFPDQAYLIATAAGLDILNAKNNKLWMRLAGGGATGNLLKTASNVTVWAQNGAIWVGSASGLYKIDLAQDLARLYTSSGNSTYASTTGAIADRDDNLGYGVAAGAVLVATSVKDIHGTNVSNKSYIGVGTLTGASVVQDETATGAETIFDYDSDATAGAQNNYASVQLTSGGELYALTDTTNRIDRWDNVNSDVVDQLTSSDRNWTTATTPALNANPSGNPDALSVNVNASTAAANQDTIFVADATGFTKIDDHATQASGTATYYERTGTVGTSNWSSERYKGAVKFDGTDDYVEIKDASGGNNTADITTNAISVGAWVKLSSNTATGHQIINKWDEGLSIPNSSYSFLHVGATGWCGDSRFDNKFLFSIASGGGYAVRVSGTYSDTNWHYVVGTYDGTSHNIYVDGALNNGSYYSDSCGIGPAIPATRNRNATYSTKVGTQFHNGTLLRDFPGIIDDVRIYNRALSASEVGDVYNGNPSASGVVGLWHFDDATGTTARDASGSANNGTLTGANGLPKFIYPAIAGTADKGVAVGSKATSGGNNPSNYGVTFASASSQYIDIGDQANLFVSGAFTAEAWIRPTTVSVNQTVLSDYNAVGTTSNFSVRVNSSNQAECFWENPNATLPKATSSATLSVNTWYHVACVWDGTTRRVFVNGTQSGTDATAQSRSDVGGSTAIGRKGANGSEYFSGQIDEVRISTGARYTSAGFTSQKYFTTDAQTQGLWHLNEGSGTSAADSSVNAYNGTLTNTPTWYTETVADEAGPYFLGNTNFAWVGTNGASADDGALTLVNLNTGARVKYYDTTTHADLPDNDITSLSMTNSGLGIAGTEAGAFPANETGTFVEAGSQADTTQGDVRIKTGGVRIKTGGVRVK